MTRCMSMSPLSPQPCPTFNSVPSFWPQRRTQLLRHLIQRHGWERTLVFVATKYATEHIALKLQRLGFAARALNGDLSQGARTQALADFKAGRVRVLIATDVAARGIDVVDLAAVVNFDLPRSSSPITCTVSDAQGEPVPAA